MKASTMQDRLALESLTQRGKTPFFNDLVTLYQLTQDTLRDSPKASSADINLTLKHIDFDKKLKIIVEKYLGITLSAVVLVENADPNMMSILQTSKRYERIIESRTQTPGMMMEHLGRVYDDRKGYLDQVDRQNQYFSFSLIIHTGWWGVRNDDGSYFFTAAELAGITLHEVGHTDHYIRTLFRVYARTLDASDIVNYINSNHDKVLILELLKSIRKSKYLDKSWLKVIDVTEEYFAKTNSADDPYYWEALSALTGLVTADIASRNLSDYNFDSEYNTRTKTRIVDVDAERSADEFAARNGAYADLTSVLLKFHQLSTSKSYLVYRQFMFKQPALFFGGLTSFFGLFSLQSENVVQGYDPLIRRMSLIVETAKHAFHDDGLSPEMRQQIIQQISESEAYIKQYQSNDHHKVRSAINTWKDNVGKFGRIIVFPFRNKLTEDYEKLQNANRSLTRHPLYYLAKK